MENSIQRMPLPSPRKRTGELGGGVPSWESSISLPSQLESRLNASLGGGQGLPNQVRSQMEGAFGRSFSDVHIHTDSVAAEMSSSIGARAFTYGNDIFFNRGQFSSHSSDGQHLIAHELAHVTQGSGRIGREPNYTPLNPDSVHNSSVPSANQAMLEKARSIQVTDKEGEGKVREGILKRIDVEGNLDVRTLKIEARDFKGSLKGEKTNKACNDIKGVLSETTGIIELAAKYHSQASSDWVETQAGRKDDNRQFARQLVQQVYNTLSQISIAMDILPKPKAVKNDVKSLRTTSWIQCRDEYNKAVTKLARVAKNPAIAVLMYEGSYYPTEFSGKTSDATRELVGKKLDSSLLLFYGAVCNNAAYGSVYASGANYKFKETTEEADRKRIVGLQESGTSRTKWSNYDLQGTGLGDDALDHAKQGDVVIFWHFSKIGESTSKKEDEIISKLKKQRDAATKRATQAKTDLEAARRALRKAKDDESREAAQANVNKAESAKSAADSEKAALNDELSQKKSAKSKFNSLLAKDQAKRTAMKEAEKKYKKDNPSQKEKDKYFKAKTEYEAAHKAYLDYISEGSEFYNANVRRAQAAFEEADDKATFAQIEYIHATEYVLQLEKEEKDSEKKVTDAEKKLAGTDSSKRNYKGAKKAYDDAVARHDAAIKNHASVMESMDFSLLEANIEAEKHIALESKGRYADAIINGDVNAHHTEIIVGVREKDGRKEYLLSGAHGSNYVNGMARDSKGNLAWKTVEQVRGESILRRVPVDNDEEVIPVDIPSDMGKQRYSVSKKAYLDQSEAFNKSHHLAGNTGSKEELANYLSKQEVDKWEEIEQVRLGSYETKTGTVTAYANRNLSESITIHWIGKKVQDKAEDTSQEQ